MSAHRVTRSTRLSQVSGVVFVALVAGLIAAPWWGTVANLRLIGEIMVYLALASLWNLLAGYSGLVSVGQQAFVGFGG